VGAAVVGELAGRALIAWSERGGRLRYAQLDEQGRRVGPLRTVPGRHGELVATSAFSGALFVRDGQASRPRLGVVRLAGRASPANVRLGRGLHPESGFSAAAVGDQPVALVTNGGQAHLLRLARPDRVRDDRTLGTAGDPSETAIDVTPWGALGSWTNRGVVSVVSLDSTGNPAGEAFSIAVAPEPERAQSPAVAATQGLAAVVWVATGRPAGTSIRLVRVSCQ
jgi:hypothetical protein